MTAREKTTQFVESQPFRTFILAVIFLNAITIGIETARLSPEVSGALAVFDNICLAIYIIEAILKIYSYRLSYFRDPWNVFDFVIILLCLPSANIIPFPAQVARVLRVFRVFRVFRVVSAFREMRVIIEGIGKSLPGVMWTAGLLFVIFYIFAVLGTNLFGEAFPEWFGNLGASMYTLFQVMTLESWSMGIARPVMEVFSWAWLYFIPFVAISAYIVINVVVGIIVGTIDAARESIMGENPEDESAKTALASEANASERADAADEASTSAPGASNAAKPQGALAAPDAEGPADNDELKAELQRLKEQIAVVENLLT